MRATIIVIDSFGIGELPDAGKYGDTGSNTALHISESVKGDKWPNL
ncbi:MAG: phosphopentomutase, partial [Spirochaetes bacterium]